VRPGDDADAALVERLRAGDDIAYETIVREYGPRLLATARRMLRNEQDALDAVQDAFLSAFKAIDRFHGDAKLSTWLHRIVINASLMKLRTKRRKGEKPITDLLPAFSDDGHRVVTDREWLEPEVPPIERDELRRTVRDKIEQLPENYRTVLLLRDIEEMDTQQTAEVLDVSTSVVKTRLHRARLALRELLAGEFGRSAT
jgi:RNA polymerase sigma-70 factor (ECF subfamily)